MAEKKNSSTPRPKRTSVSVRMLTDLLEELDAHCAEQEIPLDRTAFIEVAVRRLLDERKKKD